MNPAFRALNIPLDWPWIESVLPLHRVDDTSGIVAVDLDTAANVGACIMDNWSANSVQAHIIVTNPLLLRHGFLELITGLVYEDMGCKYIYGQVPSNNTKALKLNTHMGFKEVARLKEAYADGVDYVIMEMHRDDCKIPIPVHIEEVA